MGLNVPDVLTYTLGGTDAASFSIARDDGQLSTRAALDYETKQSYAVTVTATDPGNLSATVNVTIKVTDVNEDPELTGEAPAEYAENGTTPVTTFRATDPEGEDIVWTLTGTDMETSRLLVACCGSQTRQTLRRRLVAATPTPTNSRSMPPMGPTAPRRRWRSR